MQIVSHARIVAFSGTLLNGGFIVGPGDELVNYQRPNFISKFLELQAVMWRTNAGLTERHAYDSRPNHWPWLRRGIVSRSSLTERVAK